MIYKSRIKCNGYNLLKSQKQVSELKNKAFFFFSLSHSVYELSPLQWELFVNYTYMCLCICIYIQIYMGISSSVLVQIRSAGSATWDLLQMHPLDVLWKVLFVQLVRLQYQAPNQAKFWILFQILAPLTTILFCNCISEQLNVQCHADYIPSYKQSCAGLLCMARKAGKRCDWKPLLPVSWSSWVF